MKRVMIIFVMSILCFAGARLYALQKVPYSITGDFIIDNSSGTSGYVFSGQFKNKSERTVSSFTLVFFVFDQDGNCPLKKSNTVVVKINETIKSGEIYEINEGMNSFLSAMDSAMEGLEENELYYRVEYLYVSLIDYEDGTQWSDPFGLEIF